MVLGGAARSQQSCAQKDAHFTVLGFMASTVETLMRAVIVTAKELEYGWVQGLMDLQTGWGKNITFNQIQGVRGNNICRVLLCVSFIGKNYQLCAVALKVCLSLQISLLLC